MPPPGGVVVSPDGNLVISSQICAPLLAAAPPVPGPDYQPGIDVNGHAVAPADLPDSAPQPEIDNFPIEINRHLAGSFGVPAPGGAYGAKAILGYVTVRNNHAYFNGRPLDADQSAALAAACRGIKH